MHVDDGLRGRTLKDSSKVTSHRTRRNFMTQMCVRRIASPVFKSTRILCHTLFFLSYYPEPRFEHLRHIIHSSRLSCPYMSLLYSTSRMTSLA